MDSIACWMLPSSRSPITIFNFWIMYFPIGYQPSFLFHCDNYITRYCECQYIAKSFLRNFFVTVNLLTLSIVSQLIVNVNNIFKFIWFYIKVVNYPIFMQVLGCKVESVNLKMIVFDVKVEVMNNLWITMWISFIWLLITYKNVDN